MTDLGVTKTHSHPHVSNDNPYSEAQFTTLKYRPEFPNRSYNTEHRHRGIAMLPPADVHAGRVDAKLAARAEILEAAFAAHPERFVRGLPKPAVLPPRSVDQPTEAPAAARRREIRPRRIASEPRTPPRQGHGYPPPQRRCCRHDHLRRLDYSHGSPLST